MFAVFCWRLACGLVGALLVFSPRDVNPRFYRVHFLTALTLTAAAGLSLRSELAGGLLLAWTAAVVLALLGALAWSLEGSPGGKLLIGLTLAALVATLALAPAADFPGSKAWLWLGDDLTSAAVLGTATTALLMGHSYLLAPTMALTPLQRLLTALFVSLLVRLGVAAAGLWSWTTLHSLANLEDETVLWLPVRWGIGFAGPLILAWMARATAKMRSTQSATGILYVVVVLCFLGELTSLLLHNETNCVL
jgi:hypothetical protein